MAMTLEQEREAFEKWTASMYDDAADRLVDLVGMVAAATQVEMLRDAAMMVRAYTTQPAQAVDVERVVALLNGNIRHVLSEVSRGADTASLQDLATHAVCRLDGVQDEIRHALTTLGLMGKAGRGQWRPAKAGTALPASPTPDKETQR